MGLSVIEAAVAVVNTAQSVGDAIEDFAWSTRDTLDEYSRFILDREAHYERNGTSNSVAIYEALSPDDLKKWSNIEWKGSNAVLPVNMPIFSEDISTGERWELKSLGESVYHSKNGDGMDCFKWVSNRGREFVIRYVQQPDGTPERFIEKSPELIGTYNYGISDGEHFFKDVLPYWFYANSPDDSSSWMRRIHPKLDKMLNHTSDGIWNFFDSVGKKPFVTKY